MDFSCFPGDVNRIIATILSRPICPGTKSNDIRDIISYARISRKTYNATDQSSMTQTDAPRNRTRGMRYGNMERDSLVAHSAAAFLHERLMEISDPYQVYCPGYGIIRMTNVK